MREPDASRRRWGRWLIAAALLITLFAPGAGARDRPQSLLAIRLPPLPLPVRVGAPPRSSQKPKQGPSRPSRSPRSTCSDTTAKGVIPYAASVFPCDFPDPMVFKDGKTWFAYGSSTGWQKPGRGIPILSSVDLRHWHYVGDGLAAGPSWSSGDMWGPSLLHWRGRYLLYYNAERRHPEEHCLVVASGSRPSGPFRTVNMLACRSGRWQGFIDPAPFVGPRKQLLLYFSVDFPIHSIRALRLSPDGLHVRGRPRFLLSFSPYWGNLDSDTVEGPWPVHRHSFYYLFYSTGSWSSDYRMSYAVGRRPMGPFSDSAPVPLLGGKSTTLVGPGGGSVFTGEDGRTWIAFAAWSHGAGYGHGSWRTLRIAPLHWSRRGIPQVDLRGS